MPAFRDRLTDQQNNDLPAFRILNIPANAAFYVDIAGNIVTDHQGQQIPTNWNPLLPHPNRAEYHADADGTPIGRVRERNTPPTEALSYPEWYFALTGPNSEQAQQELLQLSAGEMQVQFLNAFEVEQEALNKKLTKKIQHQLYRIEDLDKPATYNFSNDFLKGFFDLLTSLSS